jgi:hypothetical protein
MNLEAHARTVEAEGETTCGEPFYSNSTKEKIAKYQEDEASMEESFMIDFINAVLDMVGINTLSELVFGNPYCLWNGTDNSTLSHGVFTEKEDQQIIQPRLSMVKGTFMLLLVLSMLVATLRLAFSGYSGRGRSGFWERVMMWFVVAVFLSSYDFLVDLLFQLNEGVIKGLKEMMDSNGLDYDSLSLMNANSFSMTDIIVFFAEWILAAFLNFIYVFRKVVIMLLLFIGPIAGMSLLFTSARALFNTWVKELTGLIFLQSVHGLLLTIYLLFSTIVSGVTGTIFKMILLILFIPLTGMITTWLRLSDSNSMLDKAGMMGVKTLATATSMMNRAKNLKSFNASSLAKQGETSISALANGRHSKLWNGMMKGTKGLGAFVGGTAGLVLGPQGAVIGASLGGKLSGGLLQGTRNIGAFGVNAKKTLGELKENGGLKSTFQNISKRKEFMGNLGETTGALFGQGAIGRNIGHTLSRVSNNRLLNSSEPGGFGGINLEKLKDMYPEANLKWIQDNKGSAMYLDKGNEQFERVSPLGAADTSLRDGTQREIGYSFSSGETLQAKQDGTYGIGQSPTQLHRTSDAMLVGKTGNGITDSSFKVSQVNPDSYYEDGLGGFNQYENQNRHPGFI